MLETLLLGPTCQQSISMPMSGSGRRTVRLRTVGDGRRTRPSMRNDGFPPFCEFGTRPAQHCSIPAPCRVGRKDKAMRTFWTDLLSAAGSAALTIGIVAFATPAAANTTLGDTPHAVVVFHQADTATAGGHTTIERRIRMAADNVCQTGDAGQ